MQSPLKFSQPDNAAHVAAIEHAWRYFQVHAGQRMTVFNFFAVFSGIVSAGLAETMQKAATSVFGIILGLLLCLLSFVFWKLDQRAAFLVKHAEAILALAEAKCMEPDYRLFCNEPGTLEVARAGKKRHRAIWTYGEAFRLMFGAMAVIGLCGAVLSALHFAKVIGWDEQQPPAAAAFTINLTRTIPPASPSTVKVIAPTLTAALRDASGVLSTQPAISTPTSDPARHAYK